MVQANLPISFWGDALLTAAYVLNHVPSKSVTLTPYELWTGRKPSLEFMWPWGSMAYVLDSSHKYGKLGPRGKKSIFIRYSDTSKGYVFVGEDLSWSVTEFEARDATFLENEFPSRSEVTNNGIELFEAEPPSKNVHSPSVEDEGELISLLRRNGQITLCRMSLNLAGVGENRYPADNLISKGGQVRFFSLLRRFSGTADCERCAFWS